MLPEWRCCSSGERGKGKGGEEALFRHTRIYYAPRACSTWGSETRVTCLGHAIVHHTAGGRRNRKRCVTSRSSCNSTASKWIPQRRLRPVLQLKPSLSLMPMSEAEITSCVAPDAHRIRSLIGLPGSNSRRAKSPDIELECPRALAKATSRGKVVRPPGNVTRGSEGHFLTSDRPCAERRATVA